MLWTLPSIQAMDSSKPDRGLICAADAVNVALRCGAPMYVNRHIAAKMAAPPSAVRTPPELQGDIVRTCRQELNRHPDPTVLYKLQMGLAVAEERYEDARR